MEYMFVIMGKAPTRVTHCIWSIELSSLTQITWQRQISLMCTLGQPIPNNSNELARTYYTTQTLPEK